MNYKQTLGLAVCFVFISGQMEEGDEWTEEPNVLVLLRLEEFLSMVHNYKQVRVLMTFVLSNMPCCGVFHPSSQQEGFDVGWSHGFSKPETWF